MKREKLIGVAITLEEWKQLRKKIRDVEDEENKMYSASSFIRSKLLLPYLNGDSPQCIQDSEQETVSPQPGHTDSKQVESFDFNFDDES